MPLIVPASTSREATSSSPSLALPTAQLRRLEPDAVQIAGSSQHPSAPMLVLRTPTASRIINDKCYPEPVPPPADAAFVFDKNVNSMPGSASFLWESTDGYVYISSTMCIGRVVEGG
jgi:hypothetical protein